MRKEQREEGEEGEGERRKKVGHYVLGPSLGEGSFAKVRVATHLISREKVAVKVVSKRLIIRRESARRNFRREALLLQHVRHPHVVSLLEAMETAHSYYLVFELAPNGHLLAYLTARKCMREAEARRFMRQIVSAVDHLHRSSIVHRDLKLENCLLNANWDIKIIDFGLSALCQRDSGLHTQCGSPAYAAPEIFGNRRYGPAVDLWSIGVCLYAMVVGRLPFLPHPPTNLTQLHALILKGAAIPTFLSPGLQQLLSGLLEVQESRRLSITDLLNQSWLTCHNSQPIARFPPVSQAPPLSVDTNVVRYMSAVFRFNESEVIHSVTERKLNASSATYHLLKRHMEGEERAEGNDNEDEEEEKVSGATSDRCVENNKRTSSLPDYVRNSAAKDKTSTVPRYIVGGYIRPVASEYGHKTVGEKADVNRPAISEYSRPSPSQEGGESSPRGESRSGCPVLRSQILPPPASRSLWGDGEKGEARDYKQCILYLKEARHHAFALGGGSRPLSNLPPHLLDKTSSTRLPLLTLHRPFPPASLQNGWRPQQAGESHQCPPEASRHTLCNHDVKLNVLGKPALTIERGGGKGDNSSYVSVTSQEGGGGRPPPPPPNTAQGTRGVVVSRAQALDTGDVNSARPSTAGSIHSQCSSLRDPFSRDTWRAVLQQHEQRLAAGESEAVSQQQYSGGQNSKGMSFVAPLSSPKALTSRDESAVARHSNYFLVRQLTADLNRRRVTQANKKSSAVTTSLPHPPPPPSPLHPSTRLHPPPLPLHLPDSSLGEEDKEEKESQGSSGDGGFGDALETERFLTPVIRVTITSTAKQ